MYPDWLTCKKSLLGGHGKAHRTVKLLGSFFEREIYGLCMNDHLSGQKKTMTVADGGCESRSNFKRKPEKKSGLNGI